ncbi:LOW QUALITY PROTEIN: platelet endothelial cell adhesion molecule [Brachionichthys hirsutus]|uniref:LOW QUALITY PROTEIN: platelet endothelial cell adhesion molecule n=1 Tax=Brachionichthys hirsutus TaxID=412623 RepID=UPI0036053FF3
MSTHAPSPPLSSVGPETLPVCTGAVVAAIAQRSVVAAIAQRSVVAAIAQRSVVAAIAQRSVVAAIAQRFVVAAIAQRSVVAAIAQRSVVAAIIGTSELLPSRRVASAQRCEYEIKMDKARCLWDAAVHVDICPSSCCGQAESFGSPTTPTLRQNSVLPFKSALYAYPFTIRDVALSIEPNAAVRRDTNVTLRCRAVVSVSGQETLSREYTVYKDSSTVYTKTSGTSEDLFYLLPQARVSNSGKYKCALNIQGKQLSSPTRKLTVTGLSKPLLHLNKGVVSEGEELTARCTAPGETGSIFFYFYEGTKEILEKQVNSNQAEAKLHLDGVGIHRIRCSYTVLISPDSFPSNESDVVTVSVKELPIAAVLEIAPHSKIYEGDLLFISCTVSNYLSSSENVHLYLSQGTKLLGSGDGNVNHSMVALADAPGDIECKLEMETIVRTATRTVLVTELFSTPTLTMAPAEVFQKEYLTLTCSSERYAPERLQKEELSYTLAPPHSLLPRDAGVFSGRVLPYEFNYTCGATARGIVKHSRTLTVRPKVSVSPPKISVVGRAVLGQPFRILCRSDAGSLPINYTLLEEYAPLGTVRVERPSQQALFSVTISRTEHIRRYMCEAQNSPKEGELSPRLGAAVVEPLTEPTLIAGSDKSPDLPDVSEGDHLYLICGVKGTPPITFKWYRVGSELPLYATTSHDTSADYQVRSLAKEHGGSYYCEAVNHANNVVRSDPVTIRVGLALWKKGVIGGFCSLALLVSVLVLVLCCRSKRASVDRAEVSVWTKRPPDAGERDHSVAPGEPDVEYSEVVHPRPVDPDRVPLRKGTDTVYSELQSAPQGAAERRDHGSVEYAELNSEQPDIKSCSPDAHDCKDVPSPMD